MKSKVSDKKVKDALELTGGMPTHAAKVLGITYSRLHQILKGNSKLQEVRESARAKLHEELENLSTFAVKTGYIQKVVLDENGNPTKDTTYEEVDVRTRLDQAKYLMGLYKGAAGIVDKSVIDHTTNGKEIKSGGITVIELPPHLKAKEGV